MIVYMFDVLSHILYESPIKCQDNKPIKSHQAAELKEDPKAESLVRSMLA